MVVAASGQASQDAIWVVMNDYLRGTYGLRALHPLSEGIALFAEHEVVPEGSTHISAVMQSAVAYFQRDTLGRAGLTEALAQLLVGARCTPEGVRRKAAVFEQPLWTGGSRGGYLAGYLTVKNLWLQIAATCPRFGDSDLFLQYLRVWFYYDWGLVHHLLDATTKDIVACERIADHIARRFNALGHASHDDAADRLEARARWSGTREQDPERFVIDTPTGVWTKGQQELAAIVDEITERPDDDKVVAAASNFADTVLSRRPLMLLGRLPVTLDIEAGNVGVSSEDRPILLVRGGVEPIPADGHGEGMLEVFAVPTYEKRPVVLFVWRGQELVGMQLSHGDLSAAQTRVPGFPVAVVDEAADRLLDTVLWLVGEVGEHQLDIARIYLNSLDKYQFEAFGQAALAFAEPDKRDAAAATMRDFGFLPVLGGADTVWALAFISVLNKTTIPTEHLPRIYDQFGGTSDFVAAFESVQTAGREAFGSNLIHGDASRYLALV
jgi:hypothetical protein